LGSCTFILTDIKIEIQTKLKSQKRIIKRRMLTQTFSLIHNLVKILFKSF